MPVSGNELGFTKTKHTSKIKDIVYVNKSDCFKPIKCQCCPYIETSQFICCANELTGFYMRVTLALNELNTFY